jgi:hypothetical protein
MAGVTKEGIPWNSRFRLHRSTCVILLLVAATLFLLIVPGEHVDFIPAAKMTGALGPKIEHGWPWVWLRRQLQFSTPLPNLPDHGIPWLQRMAWDFESGIVDGSLWLDKPGVWPGTLALDVLAGIAILVVFGIALEWRLRRRPLWRFSLAEFLAVIVVLCGALGFWVINQQVADRQIRAFKQFSSDDFSESKLDYCGPQWLRRLVGIELLPAFTRVTVAPWITDENIADLPKIIDELPDVQLVDMRAPTAKDRDLQLVSRWKRLRALLIKSNQITDAGLREVQEMPRLRTFGFLGNSQITSSGLEYLTYIPHLTVLRVDNFYNNFDIADAEVVAQLRGLTNLSIGRTDVSAEQLDLLSNLVDLRTLEFRVCEIDSRGLKCLSTLSDLESLSLWGSPIGDEALESIQDLSSLRRINLRDTQVTDEGLKYLENLTLLTNIDLRGSRVTIEGVRKLSERFPNSLISMYYYRNGDTNNPVHWKNWTKWDERKNK